MAAVSTLTPAGGDTGAMLRFASLSSPSSAARAGRSAEAPGHRHRADRAHHDGTPRSRRAEAAAWGHAHATTRADLRLRVEQTLRDWAPARDVAGSAEADAHDDAHDDAHVSLTLKARLSLHGDDGRFDARAKLKIELDGVFDAASFGVVVDRFVQALFGALHTLAGAPPLAGASDSETAPTSIDTLPPAPAVTIPGAPAPISTAGDAAPGPTPATAGQVSISIKLRIAYGGFDAAVPSLVQQLAAPDVEAQAPALEPMFADMRVALRQMWAWSSAGTTPPPALDRFLAAIGRGFGHGEAEVEAAAPTTTAA